MLSRLPTAPTAADINGNSGLTSDEDVGVYLIRATGHAAPGQTTPGVGLGGLAPPSENAALGGLPLTSEHFADFRKHRPRMRIDDLDAPVGEFVARVFPAVNKRGLLRHLADARAMTCIDPSVLAVPEVISASTQPKQSAVPVPRSSASPAASLRRPLYMDTATVSQPSARPLPDTAAFALPVQDTQVADENSRLIPAVSPAPATVAAGTQSDRLGAADSLPPPSTSRLQPHRLHPSELISTRTRRRTAAAAGQPQPDVNYGFGPDLSILPHAPRATAAARAPRRQTRVPPAATTSEPVVEPVPTVPIAPPEVGTDTPTGPLLGLSQPAASAATTVPAVDTMVLNPAELEFRESVERYTRADWAREQQKEPVCEATIRYILLNRPPSLAKDFFANVSYHHRHKPSFEEIRELAEEGRLVTDDGLCLLARKPTKTPVSSDRPGG